MDWVRDRFTHTLESADITRIDTHLEVLREAVIDEDVNAAVDEAPRLLKVTQAAQRPDPEFASTQSRRRQKGPKADALGLALRSKPR